MTTPTYSRYRTLRDALVTAPDYMPLPGRDRGACTRFCSLVGRLDTRSAAPAVEVETAYTLALKEARNLVAEGRLTANLDGEVPELVSDTQPPPVGEPKPPEAPEAAPIAPPDPKAAPELAGGEPPEDPLAVFHALVARGAKFEEYPINPAANLFPMLAGEERTTFDDSLEEDGLLDEIIVIEGQIADGRNRLRGCLERGVTPRFKEWDGKGGRTIIEFIVTKNLRRRHLNDQQRAVLAAEVARLLTQDGKERRAENLRKTPKILDGANLPHREGGRADVRAAAMVNVSPTAVKKAARLQRTGEESLVAAVTTNQVSLDAAVRVAQLPKGEQQRLVKEGNVKAAAKKLRDEKARPKPKSPPKREAKKDAEPDKASLDTEPDNSLDAEVQGAHDAIDAMVRRGLAVRRSKAVAATLAKVVEYCGRVEKRPADL